MAEIKFCRGSLEELSECGKTECCAFCDEKMTCAGRCPDSDGEEPCEDAISGDLVLMQATVPEALKTITDIAVQRKKLDEMEKAIKGQLIKAMEKHGVKKFENDLVRFTYVAPTTRTSIDSARLKKEHPEIAEAYQKTSKVSSSVRITVK